MRVTGGHELAEEAVAVVRQAVSLAARRGHAQVTPLHIARAMLSAPAPAGILRAACVRSHPLQLDLSVDLALGRLAVTRHGGHPAPSNAFVATLKRAQSQAHPYQRTGGAGGKVGVEKLVISVLDDPSVHRAIVRGAGFSSSQVRASVDASSEQSSRAGWDVAASSPNPFSDMIRAGRGQSSLPDGSGCQALFGGRIRSREPAIFGGTELDETTVNIPPWLRRYRDETRIRLTCSGTSLQADAACRRPKFTELTATNLKILCDALELRVPRHRNIVPGISSTLLRCRSGVTRRRAGANPFGSSLSTWLLFLGRDAGSKMTVARDLARLVFGSYAEFTTLQVLLSPDIPERIGSKHALKRPRYPENDGDLGGRLFEAIVENPHRVILIDGVDRLDRESEMRIKNAIVGGAMTRECNGGVVSLEDAIVVLSASDFLYSRYMASSSFPWPRVKRRFNGQNHEEGDAAGRSCCRRGWDLNVCAMDGEEEEDNLADDEGILNVMDGVFLFN